MAYTTIDDPSAYFHTQLYSGTGSAQSITNDANAGDFQPDWVWVKKRAGGTARNHTLTDSSRGATKGLFSSLNDAETTNAQGLTSFDSDGFSVGTYVNFNEASGTYVAWQWKANGGTTSSNSDGSITSTVQANTTAGFSIVTYNGEGDSQATVGHGLGVKPQVIIPKNRGATGSWHMYHEGVDSSAPEDYGMLLNATNARADDAGYHNDTAPTSSVFTVGTYNNFNYDYVAYCFAEIQGYSKFGSYTGNGNADGAFIYTGFKPAWFMCKQTNTSRSWTLIDSKRPEINSNDTKALVPNENGAEENIDADFLSNGLKVRQNHTAINESGGTYIYMAFAEHPFVSSEGVPTTAR